MNDRYWSNSCKILFENKETLFNKSGSISTHEMSEFLLDKTAIPE